MTAKRLLLPFTHPAENGFFKQIFILTTLPEKIALLDKLGIDHLVVVPFDEHFADQSAEAYVHDFLIEKFHPHWSLSGTTIALERQAGRLPYDGGMQKFGFELREIPEHVLNNAAVSSTRMREALLGGNLADANKYLGYAIFEGIVTEGNKLGRTIGYPQPIFILMTTKS